MARLDCVQKCWLPAMHHVAHLPGPLPAQAPEPQIRPLPTLQAQLGSCAGARRWSAGWTTGSCSIAIGRRESQRAPMRRPMTDPTVDDSAHHQSPAKRCTLWVFRFGYGRATDEGKMRSSRRRRRRGCCGNNSIRMATQFLD